jgi:hypothetical protein
MQENDSFGKRINCARNMRKQNKESFTHSKSFTRSRLQQTCQWFHGHLHLPLSPTHYNYHCHDRNLALYNATMLDATCGNLIFHRGIEVKHTSLSVFSHIQSSGKASCMCSLEHNAQIFVETVPCRQAAQLSTNKKMFLL